MIPRSLLAALLAAGKLAAADGVTFNKDIAPIVFANCSACHRPGEVGPFSLLTYQDVRAHAPEIARVTALRYMPPWLPEPGEHAFLDARRLTDDQIAMIRAWVDAGAPEGDPALRPTAPKFTEGWQLGPPDLVLTSKQPYALRADGPDVFHNLVFEAPVATTRYVRAVEIRLGDRKVGHHANLLIDRAGQAKKRDAADPDVGFSGMEVLFESEGFDPDSHFLFWKPGTLPYEEPEGMAWRLDRHTDLVLNMHLRPSGKPEWVQPTIGLYFTDTPPTRHPMLVQLEHDGALDIPAGTQDFAVTDELTLPVDASVLAIYPHAHYLGKEVRGLALLPDGRTIELVRIKDWDMNWQGVFRFAEPVFLPGGTKITMRWSYDNTEDNVRNPSHPPKRVRSGNRADDEMGHLWLQLLPREGAGGDPRLALQQALMRRRLEKYPADFTARYNLGAALQAEGKLDDAMREIKAAIALDPGQATAHNTLGAALYARGDAAAAAAEFAEVLRLRPDDANARYNLGQIRLAQGRTEEAGGLFREVLRLQPDDANAHAQLGAVLQEMGDLEQAVLHLREALRLDPDQLNARSNLAQALLARGDSAAAAATFREILARTPADAEAHDGLGLALLGLGQDGEAASHFRAALQAKPDDATAHDALGQILLANGEADEAARHFREVVRLRPQDADACNNLGSALAAGGHLAEAVTQFERALVIDPHHAAARANLDRARAAVPPRG